MAASPSTPFSWRRDGAAVLAAMAFPTVATYLYFVLLAGSPAMSLAAGICKTFQFVLPLAWMWFVQGRQFELTMPTRQGLLAGGLLGLAIAGGMVGLYYGLLRGGPVFTGVPQQLDAKLRDLHVLTTTHFVLMAVAVSVLHSLFEEYYWRWFVYGNLRYGLGKGWAVAVSGLAFASHHVIVLAAYLPAEHFWTATVFFSCCVAVGGMLWAGLYQRTGDLYGSWLSHMLVDFAIMLVGYDLWRMLAP